MRRYTKEQIQKRLDSLNLGHRVVFDNEYLHGRHVKLECKTCGHVWISNTNNAFVECSCCYKPIGRGKKDMYSPGIKIGEWILQGKIKEENGDVSWECLDKNGRSAIFTTEQLKYIRANGYPPYGAIVKNVNLK